MKRIIQRSSALGLGVIVLGILASNVSADTITVEKPTPKIQPSTVGWIERVVVLPQKLELEAKLSPSIALSSLHAEKMRVFKKGGEDLVEFVIEDRHGKSKKVRYPLLASKSTTTADGKKHKKKVITLPICIAGMRIDLDVLLSDRSSLEQELRIGRNDLAGHFLIDPTKTHTAKPRCSS